MKSLSGLWDRRKVILNKEQKTLGLAALFIVSKRKHYECLREAMLKCLLGPQKP